jgi:hypothetical protein
LLVNFAAPIRCHVLLNAGSRFHILHILLAINTTAGLFDLHFTMNSALLGLLSCVFINFPVKLIHVDSHSLNPQSFTTYAHDNQLMAPFPLLRQVVMSGTGRDKLKHEFVNQFKPKERKIIVEAFLQTDFRTQSPRPFQLKCAIALKTGQDVMCTAGCGAGKTLAMALPVMMLDDGKIAPTIISLKLLQQNHIHIVVLEN